MLMEAEGRNDREEELLLHDLSVAEFEMLKKKPPNYKKNTFSNINIPNV